MQLFQDLVRSKELNASGGGTQQNMLGTKTEPPDSVSLNSDAQQGRTYLEKVSGRLPVNSATSGITRSQPAPTSSPADKMGAGSTGGRDLRQEAINSFRDQPQTTKGGRIGTRGNIIDLNLGGTGAGARSGNLNDRSSLPLSAAGLTPAKPGAGQHLADPDPATQSPDPAGLLAGWNADAQRSQYWRPETLAGMQKWDNVDAQKYAEEISAREAEILDATYKRMMGNQMRDMQASMGARGMGMGGAASALAGDIAARAALDRANAGIGIRQGARGEALGQQQAAWGHMAQEADNIFGGQFEYGDLQLRKNRDDRAAEMMNRLIDIIDGNKNGGGGAGEVTGEVVGGATGESASNPDDILRYAPEVNRPDYIKPERSATTHDNPYVSQDGDVSLGRFAGNNLDERQERAAQAPRTSGPVPPHSQPLTQYDDAWPGGVNPDEVDVWWDDKAGEYYIIPKGEDPTKEKEQMETDFWGSVLRTLGINF